MTHESPTPSSDTEAQPHRENQTLPIDEQDPVAYLYEVRRRNHVTDRTIVDWHPVLSEDPPGDWKEDDTTTHDIRHVCPLVHGPDPDAPDVLAYSLEYKSAMSSQGWNHALLQTDPRESDYTLRRVKPLVPADPTHKAADAYPPAPASITDDTSDEDRPNPLETPHIPEAVAATTDTDLEAVTDAATAHVHTALTTTPQLADTWDGLADDTQDSLTARIETIITDAVVTAVRGTDTSPDTTTATAADSPTSTDPDRDRDDDT